MLEVVGLVAGTVVVVAAVAAVVEVSFEDDALSLPELQAPIPAVSTTTRVMPARTFLMNRGYGQAEEFAGIDVHRAGEMWDMM